MRNNQNVDLVLMVALAAAQLGLSFASDLGNPGRWALGVVAVVFAPGYALTAAVWPDHRLPSVERLALSLGLSLSLATLGGLILYAIGVGLRPVPWAVLLGVPTVIGSLVAFRRRSHQTDAHPNDFARGPVRRPTWLGLALGGTAAAISVAAVAVAVAGASQPDEDFSQLWLLPISNANGGSVEVGLRSQELAPTTFHIQVLDGQSVALDTPDVRLAPGETWTSTVQLTPTDAGQPTSATSTGDSDPIQALAYRADAPETPYRRVELQPASATGQ